MTRNVSHTPFETMHASVPAFFLVGTLGVTMCAHHPVYQAITLFSALTLSVALRGGRATLRGLRWQLPMLALVCLANPLFSASGSTDLLRLGPTVVYAESLAYGACSGAMMVSTVLWLECGAALLGEKGLRSLGARRLPVVTLMVSMAAQLVPQLVRRSTVVKTAADACTASGASHQGVRVEGARLSTMLMSWAMEDSLERADAMRARGWGATARRTSYQSRDLRESDVLALLALGLLIALNAFLAWVACAQWHFYPTMPRLAVWWGYLPFAAQALLPTFLTLIDRLRWRMLP